MKSLIIFYDGPCVLCNYWIQKLCQWDRMDKFKFSSLDSEFAINFFNKNPSPLHELDTVISWDYQNGYQVESEVIFRVLMCLRWPFKIFLIFSLLPKSITNSIYRFIAKNRYRWFGKFENCPLPDKKFINKFL